MLNVLSIATATTVFQCIGNLCRELQGCEVDGQCDAGEYCANPPGICLPRPDCFDDADCGDGERCDQGSCVPQVCRDDDDCGGEFSCVAGRCLPPFFCEDAGDCPIPNLQCINNVCTAPNGYDDEECGLGLSCIAGVCAPVPPPECRSDDDCGQFEQCEFGFCIPRQGCRDDNECPAGQICEGRECVPDPSICRSDDDLDRVRHVTQVNVKLRSRSAGATMTVRRERFV